MALFPLGILSAAGAGGAVRIAVAGYFAGGVRPGQAYSTVDKLAFPAETVSTLGTGLSAVSASGSAFANSGVAGYVSLDTGGTVNKFAFPSDSRSTLATGLSIVRNNLAAFANSGVAGYATGGLSTVAEVRIDKFSFPSDTRSTLSLPSARWTHATFQNTGVAGYTGGGIDASLGGSTDTVMKVTFPSDSTSTLGTGLSRTAFGPRGISNAGVAGYVAGGDGPSGFQTANDKFSFPSDTRSTGTTLSVAKRYMAGANNSGVAGYIAGGETVSDRVTTIERFAYPADTRTTLAAGLSVGRSALDGMSDEGVF